MAKKAKKKVRTTAQRRAAALASWELRRLQGAKAPTPVKRSADKLPSVAFDTARPLQAPTTAAATREGDELYITIASGGSLHRHKVSLATMRKLGLDCLQLVG